MKKEFINKDWSKKHSLPIRIQNWILPDDFVSFTLDDWLEYSGGYKIEHVSN